ncbi:hypothetical protein CU254_35950 [Amycolatopsis sp. AA4]|nr:hypothetical protein CU254_35950 [Amycolatopsis sp. AA4]
MTTSAKLCHSQAGPVFHNRTDEGAISFGTALNSSLGLDIGCRLFPPPSSAALRRPRPSRTPDSSTASPGRIEITRHVFASEP